MKYLLPLSLFLFCISSCKQETLYDQVTIWSGDRNIESLDRNNGFKVLKLNHHISALIPYLEKSKHPSASGYTVYQVKPDSLAKFNIDEVEVKSIETYFQNNLLFRFKVEFEGKKNSLPFYLLLLDAYGGAKPEKLHPETYEWKGNRVRLKYTVSPARNATAEFTSVILEKMNKKS